MRSAAAVTLAAVVLIAGCAAHSPRPRRSEARTEVLNGLRDDINAAYGFRDSTPRVNLGPCGRFARDFHVRWNERFADKCHVAFVMSADGSVCHHVVVRLPEGRFYDGGNGVVDAADLLALYPGSRLEDMPDFDATLLDRRSYGLARTYPECPNYSDAFTRRIIDRHLALLPR
jgi:hypothetical protein